ncbi:Hypothetical Protein FCC1311_059892 [Hondaea fermentalgiana]|uniref:Uncharacterized protein n=1 Tax=Hondaea fermentalgiana TaxID=2315210 RepID=A0A2R5GJ62_9STRA|nr:Hypothetical Protein FCC1311_059892 [Hondaea fermentalgiana]|eukprot:GBG29768.1 Hypothetical Protein FCC1311_059892 [Hondaea fermentalgiana]
MERCKCARGEVDEGTPPPLTPTAVLGCVAWSAGDTDVATEVTGPSAGEEEERGDEGEAETVEDEDAAGGEDALDGKAEGGCFCFLE